MEGFKKLKEAPIEILIHEERMHEFCDLKIDGGGNEDILSAAQLS